MSGDPTSPPAGAADTLDRIRGRLLKDPTALGERLMVLASGPVAVAGAAGGVLALDPRGATVLVCPFSSLPAGASAELSDELDRLAQLSPAQLAHEAGDSMSPRKLAHAHARFFDLPDGAHPALNKQQRAMVVLSGDAGKDAWKDLRADLGPDLAGVFAWEGDRLIEQELPSELAARIRGRSFWTWIGAAAIVFGVVGFLLAGVVNRNQAPPGVSGPLISAGSPVAGPVGSDATHTQWVGQRRLARLSGGRLLAVYATGEGLQLVVDRANQGLSWQTPQLLGEVVPQSLGVAVDPADRIHIAFRDAQGVGYLSLRPAEEAFVAGGVLRLDTSATSPVVDIGFDPTTNLAHIVWVRGDADQQPVWAAVSAPPEGEPSIAASEPLTEPGNALSTLVNIGAGPGGRVLATYRRSDSVEGWFARYLDAADPGRLAWSPEERLPVAEALFGAASLAVDAAGAAHLVLRDNTTYGLTYLRRSGDVWSPPETIVDVETTEEIDFPSVSPDSVSELVYVFYQDTRTTGRGQIKVALRDPAAGWGTPATVAGPDDLLYPTSIGSAAGSTVLLATEQGAPQIRAFRAGPG